jgi:hypothetical protein
VKPVYKTEINGRGDSLRWSRDTLCPLKLAINSRANGGRSVGIFRLRTKATHLFLFVYPKVKRPLEISARKYSKVHIDMVIMLIERKTLNQIHMNWGYWWALVKSVMIFQFPQKAANFLRSLVSVYFLRITLLHGVIWLKYRTLYGNARYVFQFGKIYGMCLVQSA